MRQHPSKDKVAMALFAFTIVCLAGLSAGAPTRAAFGIYVGVACVFLLALILLARRGS